MGRHSLKHLSQVLDLLFDCMVSKNIAAIGGGQWSDNSSVHNEGRHSLWSQLSGPVPGARPTAEQARAIHRDSAKGSGRNEKQSIYK